MFESCICAEPDDILIIDKDGFVRAETDKKCCECSTIIPAGRAYYEEVTFHPTDFFLDSESDEWIEVYDEDDLATLREEHPEYEKELEKEVFATCQTCKNMRDSLMKCGWIWGRLYQDIADHYGDECV